MKVSVFRVINTKNNYSGIFPSSGVNGEVPGAYFGSEIFNDFRKIVDGWAAADPRQLQYFGGKSLITTIPWSIHDVIL